MASAAWASASVSSIAIAFMAACFALGITSWGATWMSGGRVNAERDVLMKHPRLCRHEHAIALDDGREEWVNEFTAGDGEVAGERAAGLNIGVSSKQLCALVRRHDDDGQSAPT